MVSAKPFRAPHVSNASSAYRLHVGSCLQLDPSQGLKKSW